MEMGSKPSHAKTFKEIKDEKCEKVEEATSKPFKDSLHLRCVVTSRTTTAAKDGAGHTRPDSPLAWNMAGRFGRRIDERGETVATTMRKRPPFAKEKPKKMSLIALLADNGGFSEDDDDEDKDGLNEKENERETKHDCSKYMVQHMGDSFIPCGHTFGRLFSRELWACHEICPLCNGFIMEILDAF